MMRTLTRSVAVPTLVILSMNPCAPSRVTSARVYLQAEALAPFERALALDPDDAVLRARIEILEQP